MDENIHTPRQISPPETISQKIYTPLFSRDVTERYAPLKQGNKLRKKKAWDPGKQNIQYRAVQ